MRQVLALVAVTALLFLTAGCTLLFPGYGLSNALTSNVRELSQPGVKSVEASLTTILGIYEKHKVSVTRE